MIVTKDVVIDMGLHDSVIEDIDINLINHAVNFNIKLSKNKKLNISFINVRSVRNININHNEMIILDYKLEDKVSKFFSTFSEWITLEFDECIYTLEDEEI